MIEIKTKGELAILRENGRRLATIMEELKKMVEPGVKGEELEDLAETLISKYEGIPSFKGYNGFPSALCLSLNEEIVHGVPKGKTLKKGDIVSLDLGFGKDGFHSDMAVSLPVGRVSRKRKRLISSASKALNVGLQEVRPGATFGDIGHAIEEYILKRGYAVIKDLCGHGIGRELHQEPDIPNWGTPGSREEIREGMVFCLEPMLSLGSEEIEKGSDGFAYIPRDGSLSSHAEHMMAVTNKGVEILTKTH